MIITYPQVCSGEKVPDPEDQIFYLPPFQLFGVDFSVVMPPCGIPMEENMCIVHVYITATVCPTSRCQFYIVTYYTNLVNVKCNYFLDIQHSRITWRKRYVYSVFFHEYIQLIFRRTDFQRAFDVLTWTQTVLVVYINKRLAVASKGVFRLLGKVDETYKSVLPNITEQDCQITTILYLYIYIYS